MMIKCLKKVVRILLCILAVALIAAASYVIYFLVAYHRVPDNLELEVQKGSSSIAKTNEQYTILSWNIGFGAYESDFDFFMDGGTQSRAKSKQSLDSNLSAIADLLRSQNADLYIIQEVDLDGTRSYHVDESRYLISALDGYSYSFAENWDCPYILFPVSSPHGKNQAGIMTFSSLGMESALRRSLPIEDSVMKYVDLDRCYSISRIPVEGGKELVLINFHLSAYTSDGQIAFEQLEMVLADMRSEYEKGNYCIAGGDFNKDLLGGGSELFGVVGSEYSWAQPIPEETFEGTGLTLVGPYDPDKPVPSCRNADAPFWEGQYQVTIDGFITTANVEVVESHVIDTGFAYSDHNPVSMSFILK